MELTREELEQLLRLSLAALKAQAGQGGVAVPVPQLPEAPASTGPTVGVWLETFDRIISEQGLEAGVRGCCW